MTTTESLTITNMLNSVAERGATDIHFTVGSPAYVRINGILSAAVDSEVITPAIMESLVNFFEQKSLFSALQQANIGKNQRIIKF